MKRKMKMSKLWMLLLCVVMMAVLVTGCKKSENPISQEGTEDATVFDTETLDMETESSDTETQTETTGTIDTQAPEQLNMIYLMDAINMMVDYQYDYSKADDEQIWKTLRSFLYDRGETIGLEGLSYDEDWMLVVKPEIVEQTFRAMYGNVDALPPLPEEYLTPVEEGMLPDISINDAGDYVFMGGDRGMCEYKLISWNQEADGTHKVELSLVTIGPDAGSEIVTYLFTLQEDDTNPLFHYRIVDAKPANKQTEDKVSGIPYLFMNTCIYGGEEYPDDEIRCNTIVELPNFGCFNFDNQEVHDLNTRINEDLHPIYEAAWENTENWPEIKSYMYQNDQYIQVVSTAITYPNYGTYGDVYSYNYDIENQKAMTLEDGLALASVSEQELQDAVKAAFKPEGEGEEYQNAELGGFRVKNDGTVDFYLKLFIHNSLADDHDMLAVYHMSDKTLECSDKMENLADVTEEEEMTPALKHKCE